MEQHDRAFKEYWEKNAARLIGSGYFTESAALTLWRAAQDSYDSERNWFRSVCAEEMGVDAPGGEACHPLRDWLKRLKAIQDGGALGPSGLLSALKDHGGPLESLADAGLLFLKKGEDYNTGFSRDEYFPLGLPSYAQMLWVKCLRLLSFAKAPRAGNFEGPMDTLLDLISYAAFARDWLKRDAEKMVKADAEHAKNIDRIHP